MRLPLSRIYRICALVLLSVLPAMACAQPESERPLSFLIGDWVGEGSGSPGVGQGAFSFKPELRGQVLVRRSKAEYPAAAGRPAVSHEDLLIVYPCRQRAIYFDNEGHVIEYQIVKDEKIPRVTFVSAPGSKPAFRLIYDQHMPGQMKVSFEISPTGLPSDFQTYVQGAVRRVDE